MGQHVPSSELEAQGGRGGVWKTNEKGGWWLGWRWVFRGSFVIVTVT